MLAWWSEGVGEAAAREMAWNPALGKGVLSLLRGQSVSSGQWSNKENSSFFLLINYCHIMPKKLLLLPRWE